MRHGYINRRKYAASQKAGLAVFQYRYRNEGGHLGKQMSFFLLSATGDGLFFWF